MTLRVVHLLTVAIRTQTTSTIQMPTQMHKKHVSLISPLVMRYTIAGVPRRKGNDPRLQMGYTLKLLVATGVFGFSSLNPSIDTL